MRPRFEKNTSQKQVPKIDSITNACHAVLSVVVARRVALPVLLDDALNDEAGSFRILDLPLDFVLVCARGAFGVGQRHRLYGERGGEAAGALPARSWTGRCLRLDRVPSRQGRWVRVSREIGTSRRVRTRKSRW